MKSSTMSVLAAWLLTALVAVGVASSVYRIPMQVTDSLDLILDVNGTASAGAAFAYGLRGSTGTLRPLRQTQTRLLLDVGHAMGGRHHEVFRGFHALGVVALIALFTAVSRPRSWLDLAALAFAFCVLTGLHTFAGMMRESYPINHFLHISLYCLAALALAQSSGGILADLAAIACLVLAALTLESGVLVWVVAVAGYAAGLRGISRRALGVMTVSLVFYVMLRIAYVDASPGLGERATGFGAAMVTEEQQIEYFGDRRWLLYAYTVASSAASLLLSQPMLGQWTVIEAWRNEMLDPVYAIQIGTSISATALIGWFLLGRARPDASRRWREPPGFIMLAVVAANATMSYAYAKNEIISVAGVFYALLIVPAAAAALERAGRRSFRPEVAMLAVIVLAVTAAWGFRSLGLQYTLRRSAFNARMEWVIRTPPYGPEQAHDEPGRALAAALKQQALAQPVSNPSMLPRWAGRYWGGE